ncbi:MAG: MBL fold metallo-hydrolase, partial [Saprospiraceae bacterium]
MKVQFCGAAQQVTGSSHLITLSDGYKILLDCGIYQGRDDEMKDFNENWLFKPSEIDCLILSHAHIDHTGRVPKLVKDGFRGTILCTHATRSLCSIMLMDSAKIQERDAHYHNKKNKDKKEPLYNTKDALETMRQFTGLSYERWHYVHDGVRLMFRDAGHILGSSSVTLEVEENDKKIRFGFTGDIGRPERPILRDPQPMPKVDYLICESTYGNKEHEARPKEHEKFLSIIKEVCVENQGKLLIPAFSVGRTQEIVHMLDKMHNEGVLPKIPVYVDSPL